MRRLALALLGALLAGLASAGGLERLEGHGGPVKGVAVDPGGRWAATASFDYTVGLWPLGGGAPTWLEGHRAAVNAVVFHPDGRLMLSAGDDFDLILWDRETSALRHRFAGHRGKILAIALAPGGRLAATAGWDGRVGLWDLEARRHVAWVEGHRGPVNAVAFTGEGALLSGSYDGTVRLWQPGSWAERATLVSAGFGVNRMVIGPDGRWLAYGTVDGGIRVIAPDTRAVLADLTVDRRPILAMALSGDGTRLAVGDGEGHILIADTRNWSVERDFRAAPRGPIWALAWAGRRLLAAGIADEAVLWPVAEERTAALFAEGPRHFQRPAAEMSNGERQFVRKCAVCHSLGPDGARRAGPSLWGVFGREAGTLAGYAYSDALKRSAIVWQAETIDRLFREGPDHVTPGSKMPMQRIAKEADRADLIAYLRAETRPAPETESVPE